MVISQKDMIAYHEHAGEASNSHPPMLDVVSNEFWEQKIVRKSNGADISRLQRNVKKRDMLGLYKDGFEREKACVFKLSHKNLRLTLNSSLASSWRRRLGVLRVFLFVLSSTCIFNFGLFILEMITNLKPGEEQEDPERRYRVIDEDMKIKERTLWEIKQVITLGLMFTDKSLSKQIKLLRRFMTWCFFV
ncbi:unnamed protein product [Brassica napus]|uniref:(rape) hypothetical protein n=1 Tax=Brassica napus TaxID=3708 RepID=A0A816QMV2_BRANA|nr:unnamed protein product [Brassica napus]